MAKFFSDRPFHGQIFQLHAAVQGAVLFTWPEVSTGIGYDTLLPILFLGQDGTEPVTTCICLHAEGFGVVGLAKHRGSCQGDSWTRMPPDVWDPKGGTRWLSFSWCFCCSHSPDHVHFTSDLGESFDETAVVASKAEKTPQFSHSFRRWPVLHSFYFASFAAHSFR